MLRLIAGGEQIANIYWESNGDLGMSQNLAIPI